MCGLNAIYAYHPSAAPVDRAELLRVRDHMRARGPDGCGAWYSPDGRVGLGHRRLAIIDTSEGGAQPMASADGKLVISFNGEIYNYRQLRAALQAQGRVFRTESDTEVLLHLYAVKGIAMLDDLRGMFAFALWDGGRGALLLVRDQFGIKPLYYADAGGTLRVASQVKALLQGAVETRPSPAGQVGFMLWGSVPEPFTLYQAIKAVPAGHWLKVDYAGVGEPVSWCSITTILADAAQTPSTLDRASALECVAAAIRASVRAHQIADVPVGAFLSAGIYSGMIADVIAAPGQRPHTLTLGFAEYAGTADDEVPLAEELARRLDAWHSTLIVGQRDFDDERERMLDAMDQPSIDGINTWFVARAAARMGLKAALSGLGGDELFASYPSFAQIPKLVRYTGPFRHFPVLGRSVRRMAPLLRYLLPPKAPGLIEYGGDFGSAYLLRRCLHAPWELPGLIGHELASAGLAELRSQAMLNRSMQGIDTPRLRISALEMGWYMKNQLLRDSDWASMAHSLEIRLPLVDIELLRTAAPVFAAHPDIRKAELGHLVAPRRAASALERAKSGFSIPVRDWLHPSSRDHRGRGLREWSQTIYRHFLGPSA